MKNFWQQLPRPIMMVAPMADVTDVAFRTMVAKYSAHTRADGTTGGPDVMWTEFVSADGLLRAPEAGKQKLLADLQYTAAERPIVAQLFSSNPDNMEAAARLCVKLGFDGVDINMGCPDRSIEKQGCGAAMIQDPHKAQEIIQAAKRGAGDLPVSVKTRLGYYQNELAEWLPAILKESPAAITIHARTRAQLSKVPAQWDQITRAVEIRNNLDSQTLIFGNGDVLSLEDAHQKVHSTRADGVMIGRALFGNPWFFHPTKRLPTKLTALPTKGRNRDDIVVHDTTNTAYEYITVPKRLRVLVEHADLFCTILPHKNFHIMKKHFKAYVEGFSGAKPLRTKLMETTNAAEVATIIDEFLQSHPNI